MERGDNSSRSFGSLQTQRCRVAANNRTDYTSPIVLESCYQFDVVCDMVRIRVAAYTDFDTLANTVHCTWDVLDFGPCRPCVELDTPPPAIGASACTAVDRAVQSAFRQIGTEAMQGSCHSYSTVPTFRHGSSEVHIGEALRCIRRQRVESWGSSVVVSLQALAIFETSHLDDS